MYLDVRRVIWSLIAGVVLARWPMLRTPRRGILEKVLTQIDAAAKDFHTLQAAFVWDQFTKVVQDTDTSKGSVYFQREGGGIKMSADITDPPPRPSFRRWRGQDV